MPVPTRLAGYLTDPVRSWAELADMIEALSEVDRRGIDATLRYYGLVRLPESVAEIATTLPSVSGRRVGMSRWQVRNLISQVEQAIAAVLEPPSLSGQDPIPAKSTAPPCRPNDITRTWADAPDGRHGKRLAEGLLQLDVDDERRPVRFAAGGNRHRRYRLRRLARHAVSVRAQVLGSGHSALEAADRQLGPRRLWIAGELPDGFDSLLRTVNSGQLPDLDAASQAMTVARLAYNERSSLARPMLGLVRDALAPWGSRSADSLRADALTLATQLARESEDVAGLIAAHAALPLLTGNPALVVQLALNASIIASSHDDFAASRWWVEECLKARGSWRLPPEEARRWEAELWLAQSGTLLRQGRARSNLRLLDEAMDNARRSQLLSQNTSVADAVIQLRIGNIYLDWAEVVTGHGRSWALAQAQRSFAGGRQLLPDIEGTWAMQWYVAEARLALTLDDYDAFGYWRDNALAVLASSDMTMPHQGYKLLRLIEAAESKGVESVIVPAPDPATGWSTSYEPPPRAPASRRIRKTPGP